MRGQVSFEYLIVFCLSVSVLLSVAPVISRVKGFSDEVWVKDELDRVARDVSSACDTVKVMGAGSSVVVEPYFPLKVDSNCSRVVLSHGGVTEGFDWDPDCSIELLEGSRGLRVTSRS